MHALSVTADQIKENTMQVVWLKDFLELARTRSFTKAAENRNVTHPAFGRRIKLLEEWAGVPLVERKKPVELTPDGVIVLEAATDILETMRLLHERLASRKGDAQPDLRIATGVALSMTFFPQWYTEMCQKICAFQTRIIAGSNEDAIASLANNEVDLLLAYSSYHTRLRINPAQFDWLTISHETLVPISAPDENRQPIFTGMKEQSDPFLAFLPTTALKTIVTRHLATLDRKPNLHVIHETDSFSSIVELVAAGLGMAWLPLRLCQQALDSGRIIQIDKPEWLMPVDIALYRKRFLSHPIVDKIWASYDENRSK